MPSSRFPLPQGTLDMLTSPGRKQLKVEKDSWARLTGAVQMVFDEGN